MGNQQLKGARLKTEVKNTLSAIPCTLNKENKRCIYGLLGEYCYSRTLVIIIITSLF